MTIDIAAIMQHLQHVDLTSAAIGAAVARTAEAAIIKAIKPLPGLVVGMLRKRVQALAAAGKIDGPTLKLLKSYARATFEWVDEELPDSAGAEKMAAAIDRLAAVPYFGVLVRADRAGVEQILQAAYDAIDQEAKAGAAELGGPDATKTPPPAPAAPEAKAAPSDSGK